MIVLDASAAIALLLNDPQATATALRSRLARETLHAPHLLDLDVVQVLLKLLRQGVLGQVRADACLHQFRAMPLSRYEHAPFLARIWALRNSLTAYDAAYVALAEGLSSPLVTLDARLAAAPGNSARVEVF